MTPRKTWPEIVEHRRMDSIALALDIMFLAQQLEFANASGDRAEVARLNQQVFYKANNIQAHLQEARKT